MKPIALYLAALLALPVVAVNAQTAPPNAINFQGRLATPSGNPVPDGNYTVRVRFYDAATGGTVKHDQTFPNTPVKNGIIAILIGLFTADKFDGNTWIGITLGTDPELTPRQQIVSVPYAIKSNLALTVPNASITNAKIAPGTLTADKFAANIFNPLAWLLKGNSGVTSGFLGTTDNNPFELRVNNRRVMRYSYGENTVTPNNEYRGINVVGGSELNFISAGIVGATIAGGGLDYLPASRTDIPNSVTGDFGTIGGGVGNTASNFAIVGGGVYNRASGDESIVGGGNNNTASFINDTIGGGAVNTANGGYSFVGGGSSNTASGYKSTVSGGTGNIASGEASTISGGSGNTAAGTWSFAAGRRAKANHTSTFVWADQGELNFGTDFASTGSRQFLIRAAGGVGINTNAPGNYDLYVNGPTATASLDVFGSLYVSGTLRVGNVPFGDYRNLQINGNTGQLYYDNSSRKHKQNITPLVDDFDKLLQAVPMTYTRPNAPGRWEIGFIAEEFHDLGLKKLVDYSDKGEVEGINYEKICLYLTAIAKKQNNRLITQEKENAAKDARISELEKRLDAIERALAERKANPK